MSKKQQRLELIRNLIETEPVSSQEELLLKLKKLGVTATQSTLSRDVKEIKAVKVPDPAHGYIYIIPQSIPGRDVTNKASSIVTENIYSIEFSGQIAVLKTKSGYSNPAAVMIDNEHYEEIVGTIAGDDTIFIVLREDADRENFIKSLSSIYPSIESIYKPTGKKSSAPIRRKFFK